MPDDVVAVLGEETGEEVATSVLALAARDAVRDGEDGRLDQTASFVFSTRRTSLTTISGSIAFAMS